MSIIASMYFSIYIYETKFNGFLTFLKVINDSHNSQFNSMNY